jgi:hypothetical protein
LNSYEELTSEAQNAAKHLVAAWDTNSIPPAFQIVLTKDLDSKKQTFALKGLGDHKITWDNLQELEDAELITISYPARGPKTVRLKRALRIMVKEL